MPFSLRLTADLTLALAVRTMRAKDNHPLVLHVSPDAGVISASSSESPLQTGNAISNPAAEISRLRSPIIWIGGSAPLDHPGIARFTNELAAAGRSVFLETSGFRLKRRLHEFQPSNRFYFVVRFDGLGQPPEQRDAREEAFRASLEALRMARLAGFFICAQMVLHMETGEVELARLHTEIQRLDVDGFLITRASFAADLEPRVVRMRRRLLSLRWALLSSLFDTADLPTTLRNAREPERSSLPESQTSSFGEGAEA